ncbi:hypothetical protein ACA910_006766 [Epithemia clementina (nom. ined.)]
MQLGPYLQFDGTCAKAFDFYKTVFKSDIRDKMTFGAASEKCKDMKIDPKDADRVMHMSLSITKDIILMGSDCCPTQTLKVGDNVHVYLHADSKVHADELFAILSSEGGSIQSEIQDQFWGAYFGACTDRFGVHWMIDYWYNTDEKKE